MHLEILSTGIQPKINKVERSILFYRQDGAPSHSPTVIFIKLHEIFEVCRFTNNASFHRPSRSLKLTPMDVFLWSLINGRLHYKMSSTRLASNGHFEHLF